MYSISHKNGPKVYINNTYEAIHSTEDSENENGELPFLDCLMKRNKDGALDTTVYRKPTRKGRYLNIHYCYSSVKRQEFIKGVFLRAERLCSTPDPLKTLFRVNSVVCRNEKWFNT